MGVDVRVEGRRRPEQEKGPVSCEHPRGPAAPAAAKADGHLLTWRQGHCQRMRIDAAGTHAESGS